MISWRRGRFDFQSPHDQRKMRDQEPEEKHESQHGHPGAGPETV